MMHISVKVFLFMHLLLKKCVRVLKDIFCFLYIISFTMIFFVIKFFHICWKFFISNTFIHLLTKIMNWCFVFLSWWIFIFKSYSSTSLIFVNMFNFKLFVWRSIWLIIIFSHPLISFFWCILVLVIVNCPTHHCSHLKYWYYIQIVFLFFQHHSWHWNKHFSMKDVDLFNHYLIHEKV